MSCSSIVLEGFLQKQSGGIFLKKKQKWAVLRSDGTLSLSKKPELPATTVFHIYELDEVVYREEDCSISFCSVYAGSIVKACKFFAVESPTFEEWTTALDKVRDEPSPEYVDGRSKFLRETVSVFKETTTVERSSIASEGVYTQSISSNSPSKLCEAARLTISDEELEQQVDPILLIQSSGEPVAKSGYIKKRGGAYGGNTSYKKRFFVLTILGRVVYFADQKKTQALGQFSLLNATIQPTKQQEISVVTPTRVWFLKFDSEATRLEWTEVLESTAKFITSAQSTQNESSSSTGANADSSTANEKAPKFRRNMSLLVRQKSNIDGLGFSNIDDNDGSPIGTMPQSTATSISVACVTWNLSENLPKMLQCRFLRQYRQHQIVVVGVQECQSVMYHSFSARQLSPLDIWLAMVKSLLGEPFTLVASRAMGAIHVCMFVHEDVVGCVSDVTTSFVPCGLGNVMYNKGAVAISLKCNQTSFGFICAHLTANQEKTIERNQDFHRISHLLIDKLGRVARDKRSKSIVTVDDNKTRHQAGLFVVVDDNGDAEDVYQEDDVVPLGNSPQLLHQCGRIQAPIGGGGGGTQLDSMDSLAKQFDRCFFMGDLNYRIDAGKEWIEHYLKMAEIMRHQEKEELRLKIETDKELTDPSIKNNEALTVQDIEVVLSEEDRSSENKINKMLNLIQVGDYGTDDDSDDEGKVLDNTDSQEVVKLTSDGGTEKSGLHKLDAVRDDKKNMPATPRNTPSQNDLRALSSFKEETKLLTSKSVFEYLLSYDQLCREIGKASVFRGFVEGPIQFKPSYKFDAFTEVYDTSRKGRSPAWCDRVLYTPANIKLEQYRCIHGKFHSDHRAVAAVFTVTL